MLVIPNISLSSSSIDENYLEALKLELCHQPILIHRVTLTHWKWLKDNSLFEISGSILTASSTKLNFESKDSY